MDKIEKDFVDMYKHLGAMQGFDDSMTSIFAIVFINPEPVSLEELARKTGYSLASISNKAKFLENNGMIRRTNKPGTRKVFFYSDKDMKKNLKNALKKKVEMMKYIIKNVPKIIDHNKNVKTDNEKKKLEIIKKYSISIKKMQQIIKEGIERIDKI